MNDFQMLARFNQWVNARLYGVVGELTDSEYRQELGAFFGSIHATLNHILVIDHMWFGRFTGDSTEYIESVREILHEEFESLRRAREAFDAHIIEVVDKLGGEQLAKQYTFTLKASGRTRSMVGRHMLLTVFNHQTHHRGQVSCLLTQIGKSLPELDLPDFVRTTEQQGDRN